MMIIAQRTYTMKTLVEETDGKIYESLKAYNDRTDVCGGFQQVKEITDWIETNMAPLVPHEQGKSIYGFDAKENSDGSFILKVTFELDEKRTEII